MTSGLTKSYSILMKALFKCLLNTNRHGAPMTSLGSMFQCLTILSVNFSSLIFPSCIFVLFPHISSSVTRQKTSAPPSALSLLRKFQEVVGSPLSILFSKPSCPQPLLKVHASKPFYQLCYPSLDAFKYVNILFGYKSPEMHTIFMVRHHQC